MIQVKQNDRRPAAYTTLKHGDDPVSLVEATSVTFKMRPQHGVTLKVNALAEITDAAAGEVEYRWAVGDTDTSATYFAEWEVLWSDGTPETFPTLDYDIVHIYPDLDGS